MLLQDDTFFKVNTQTRIHLFLLLLSRLSPFPSFSLPPPLQACTLFLSIYIQRSNKTQMSLFDLCATQSHQKTAAVLLRSGLSSPSRAYLSVPAITLISVDMTGNLNVKCERELFFSTSLNVCVCGWGGA